MCLHCGEQDEVCDGLDNDCDGSVDEDNPGGGVGCDTGNQGVCAIGRTACDTGNIVCIQQNQPSDEVCDGVDNNCDGRTDEDDVRIGQMHDSGQAGVCGPGINVCLDGSLICQPNVMVDLEICDAQDNDCDGLVDEGNPGAGLACNIAGGEGVCGIGQTRCVDGLSRMWRRCCSE